MNLRKDHYKMLILVGRWDKARQGLCRARERAWAARPGEPLRMVNQRRVKNANLVDPYGDKACVERGPGQLDRARQL